MANSVWGLGFSRGAHPLCQCRIFKGGGFPPGLALLLHIKTMRAVQVVCRLPSLQMLDGKAVSEAEKDAAKGVVQHEGAMLAVMLSSACLCHKLVRIHI